MKRIISVLLLISVIISSTAVLSSCGHTHSWGNKRIIKAATCQAAGSAEYTCSCGEKYTEIIPRAHVYGKSECGEEQFCTVDGCGYSRTNPSTHSMDYLTKTCKSCGRDVIKVKLPDDTAPDDGYDGSIIKVYFSGSSYCTLSVNATCEFSATSITVKWDAEKVFCSNDEYLNSLTPTRIGYVLLDADGYVVASGYDEGPSTAVGNKIRGESFTINGLEEWESYTLAFTDVK